VAGRSESFLFEGIFKATAVTHFK